MNKKLLHIKTLLENNGILLVSGQYHKRLSKKSLRIYMNLCVTLRDSLRNCYTKAHKGIAKFRKEKKREILLRLYFMDSLLNLPSRFNQTLLPDLTLYNVLKISFFVIGISFMVSCDDSLTISDFTPDENTIVVDGWIETDEVPKVILTYSIPYFSYLDSNIFNFVDARAKVSVSDGEIREILTLKSDRSKFPYFTYTGKNIKGETGKTYFLLVEHGSRTIHAETTIPDAALIDSCWFEASSSANDSLSNIWVKFDDPNEKSIDYYRILTKSEEQNDFTASLFPNYSDETLNTKSPELPIYQKLGNQFINSPEIYFNKYDSYTIKIQTMTAEIFDIWKSYQNENYNAANPYSESKINVKSNISGDGIGIWAGYGVSFYELEKEAN